jgi:hypothetical protein
MHVSSLEHVMIRAKLGDIIGFQIIQIAAQKASFQVTINALAIDVLKHASMHVFKNVPNCIT